MQQTAFVLCLFFAVASAVHHQQASSDFVQSGPVASIDGVQHPGAVFEHGVPHPSIVGGQVQPNFYSPAAGIIQVVGGEPKAQQGVVGGSSNVATLPVAARYAAAGEQYGQPESPALPANYKPFGSWGLYIGGNPADGYYSNYYKSLGDKQQVGSVSGVEQASAGGVVKPSSSSSVYAPIQRQAFVGGAVPQPGSFVGSEYYPIAYSPADLNSIPAPAGNGFVSPVHAGAQIYGTPASFDHSLSYAAPESYASVKSSKAGQSKGAAAQESYKEVQQQQQAPVKGAVPPRYAYAVLPQYQHFQQQQPLHQQQYHQHQQVVSYPVPVGSQIVGSQAGVDGAFQPYGVHAFTKYAVKPAVVSANSASSGIVDSGAQQQHPYYYQYPSYKAQGASAVNALHQSPGYQAFSFYGYPLGQLHYNSGSVPSGPNQVMPMYSGPVGSFVGQHEHHHHQSGSVVNAAGAPVGVDSHTAPAVGSSGSSSVVHSSGSAVVESPVVSDKHVVEGVQKDKSIVDAQAQ